MGGLNVQEKELSYKVGDLVVNLFAIELAFDEFIIEEGAVGLIVSYTSHEVKNVSGYHYNILISGREVSFFEREIKPFRRNK
tara:strand:- start:128 stop:373 length:246 start_codon:yes stop_codon:yes gene_type:complete